MYTGYWVENRRILGPQDSGEYCIIKNYIHGPQHNKLFWVENQIIFGPWDSKQYWIDLDKDGRIYGPDTVLPWQKNNVA